MEQITPHSSNTHAAALRLGARHGYRIDGDLASLNAELSGGSDRADLAQGWALQLWACDAPYEGGALHGIKVAEAPIELSQHSELSGTQLDAEAFAHIPAAQRDYSMVLVLASGTGGAFAQVHDFANYPARQRFVAPHLDGTVGYRVLTQGGVELSSQRVINPRSSDNLSGSLSLQLWALHEAYHGGEPRGHLLASAQLGRVSGQDTLSLDAQWLPLAAPPEGDYAVALVLCEWTAAGYLTRDYCNFAERYTGPTLAVESSTAVNAPVTTQQQLAATSADPSPVTSANNPIAAKPAAEPVAARTELKAAVEVVPAAVAASESKAEAKLAAEAKPTLPQKPSESKPAEVTLAVTAKPAEAKPAAQAKVAVAKPSDDKPAALVSLQSATVEQLAQVPGINKKLASEIVKARPFKSLDELSRVRGLGESSIRKLRALLSL